MASNYKHNIFNNRKKGKDIVCTNCNSLKHTYKYCNEPITSWGVILVSYDASLSRPTHQTINLMDDDDQRISIESASDRYVVASAYYGIQFLMVSRKYSVGYVEFIRGRYKPEKIDQVIYLFKQMMQSEIDKINSSLTMDNGFEYLWKDFWGSKHDTQYYLKDRDLSKANYEMLKVKGVDGPDLDLKYIVQTVKADYAVEEWGFPKGRKKKVETERDCAIREFKEESGYTDEDFRVIDEIEPLVEDLIGTNGINYRHVYYVAELLTNKGPGNNLTESQKEEIGKIQFMNFATAVDIVRDYHISRKSILSRVFTYYLDKLVIANRTNETNTQNIIVKKNKSADYVNQDGWKISQYS